MRGDWLRRGGIGFLALGLAMVSGFGAARARASDANGWSWDAQAKHVDVPVMTNHVYYVFWVTNTAPEPATILAVEADCDCTVVEARQSLPWTFQPGQSGALNVRINSRGRFGRVERPISVFTSRGKEMLVASLTIPLGPAPSNVSVRQQDLQVAKTNRQAVFSGRCAPCHAAPALQLTGAPLFDRACGICHQSKHRADFVPDLAAADSRRRTAADWRHWITYGKTNTVMPAFAQSEGGILDAEQIESLVSYLMTEFSGEPISAHPGAAPAGQAPARTTAENEPDKPPEH